MFRARFLHKSMPVDLGGIELGVLVCPVDALTITVHYCVPLVCVSRMKISNISCIVRFV